MLKELYMTAIVVNDLFINRRGDEVLRGISFTVEPGSVYALLGGNGAGKSTTLLTLLGFLSLESGTANVLDYDVTKHVSHIRQQIAYLPEAATLYPHLNAYENLEYFLDLAGKKTTQELLDKTLDEVGLQSGSRARHMDSYSKGMRQKVAIALAILRETPVLLLDEPTSGLDPIAIDEFNALVRNLAGMGKTILMVTHDVYGACQVADRIGLLRSGQLVGSFDATNGARIDTELVHATFAERASA
jgi:ABC-2 type transport system ATP-binding protein